MLQSERERNLPCDSQGWGISIDIQRWSWWRIRFWLYPGIKHWSNHVANISRMKHLCVHLYIYIKSICINPLSTKRIYIHFNYHCTKRPKYNDLPNLPIPVVLLLGGRVLVDFGSGAAPMTSPQPWICRKWSKKQLGRDTLDIGRTSPLPLESLHDWAAEWQNNLVSIAKWRPSAHNWTKFAIKQATKMETHVEMKATTWHEVINACQTWR